MGPGGVGLPPTGVVAEPLWVGISTFSAYTPACHFAFSPSVVLKMMKAIPIAQNLNVGQPDETGQVAGINIVDNVNP